MVQHRSKWVIGGVLILAVIVVPLVFILPGNALHDDPWASVPEHLPQTDHTDIIGGPLTDGPAVTRACLECHEDAAHQVMQTAHWTWEGEPVEVAGHEGLHQLGKKNVINNFCIGVQSNWVACTACHAGYGWEDDNFDFSNEQNVDCLVCHDHSGTYVKSARGLPADGVDLLAAAQSVGGPTRGTCGSCHFRGGGGDAVKHGDLDRTLIHPRDGEDVHMGRHQLVCTDCHTTSDHQIRGRSISVSVDRKNLVECTDCHSTTPHGNERLDAHTASVACATCHIPEVALREATKTHWDWSTAGQDDQDDPHVYLKKKGSFTYETNLRPEYAWWNGTADRYLLGDPVAAEGATALNPPRGGKDDPQSRIWPFKVHRGRQIYDTENRYLLVPKTVGEGGYWADFDWDQAARLGAEATGLEYSGSFDFVETEMFWPLAHMVAPADRALQCVACHADDGLLDWEALGYAGDPIQWGGRGEGTR